MATFSRSSTAYKSDGSVVNAGVPRIESGKGVLVEEGTTNLIPVASQDFVTNWLSNAGETINVSDYVDFIPDIGLVTCKRIQGQGNGTSKGKYRYRISNITNARTDTVSCWIKLLSGNASISNTASYWQAATVDWQRLYSTVSHEANTNTDLYFMTNSITDKIDILVYQPQLEAKPYPTTFHPTTRSAESLTIPANALNASEGTIEFDVYFDTIPYSNDVVYFLETRDMEHNSANTAFTLGIRRTDRRIRLTTGDGNSYANIFSDASNVINAEEKCRLALRYKNGEYVSVFGKGAKWIQTTNSLNLELNAKLLIGAVYTMLSDQPNCFFSNLRISAIARTDAELANTGALTVDEYTTYFAPLTSNLGAQGEVASLSSGEGITKQSRTGAGYRSMTAKAAVKSYILRTAKFYPLITVDVAGGKVLTSRVGSGYRTAAIMSTAEVKLIEPSVEICPEIREREATTTIVERQSTTEVIGVPYAGDTIKIKGTFKSFEGVAADPTSITLKIYDTINNLLTTINVTSANRVSAGTYEVEYTVPEGYQALYYEWHCTQGDTPQVTTGKITVLKRGQAS